MANTIRTLRKALGMTQQELADAVKVSRPAVVYWEQGKQQPRIKHIPALAKALKCDISVFLRPDV